jgi:tryptophanyl-tRNA synthetase
MRIFSGIQPTGKLHIGNYFGAIKNMVKFQEGNGAIFSVVDLHAITVDYDPKDFQSRINDTILDFLACGIDPQKSIIFIQSQIKEHTELAWFLNTVTSIGELQRMTQFKDKSQKEEIVNAGLLNYPVLMTADILLYNTEAVPVGGDQKQHLELTQNIIRRFNNKFGETFKDIKPLIPQEGARIMSLKDPSKKMSKSEPDGCLFITDTPEEIERKIKSAVTDTERTVSFDPEERPALANLLMIYALSENKEIKDIDLIQFDGHASFKKALTESLIKTLAPVREKRKELEQKPEYIKEILEEGRVKAQSLASEKMEQVKKVMGLH